MENIPEEGKPRGRPWPPGTSGNPAGRPKKGRTYTDMIREYLDGSQEIEVGKGKRMHTVLVKRKEMFIRSMFQEVIKGNVAAQRLFMNYLDGLPQLNVSVEGRLVNLSYDMELSAEDEEWYGELLSQFFIEPEALRKPKTKAGEANARRRKGKD